MQIKTRLAKPTLLTLLRIYSARWTDDDNVAPPSECKILDAACNGLFVKFVHPSSSSSFIAQLNANKHIINNRRTAVQWEPAEAEMSLSELVPNFNIRRKMLLI